MAVVSPVIPNILTLTSGQKTTFTYVTAIKTSLDSTDPLSDATIEYYNAVNSLSELKPRHVQEWAKLWGSRIEFAGNLPLAQVRKTESQHLLRLFTNRFFQVVNSTLYYLLSSARQDVPWSLSPGGLASNSYK